MQKYPSDVSVSNNCIDANLEMVERREPDNFPCFPLQEWCAWTIPEIDLNWHIKRFAILAVKKHNFKPGKKRTGEFANPSDFGHSNRWCLQSCLSFITLLWIASTWSSVVAFFLKIPSGTIIIVFLFFGMKLAIVAVCHETTLINIGIS